MSFVPKWLGLALVFLALTVGTASQARAGFVPALDISQYKTSTQPGAQITLGYEFSTTQAIVVTSLAYFADNVSLDHEVGIWDAGGTLLASTTVLATDTQIGAFRYHTIADLQLTANTSYVVGGQALGENFAYQAQLTSLAPGISFTEGRYIYPGGGYPGNTSDLTFPSLTAPADGISEFGGSFGIAAAPEPSTIISASMAGLMGIGYALRHRKAKLAA